MTDLAISPVVTPLTATKSAPMAITFAANASGINPPFTYAWDFGDGNSSTNETGSHSYVAGGTYTIRLVVTDSLGRTASWSESYVVNPVLVPNFSAVVTIGVGGTNSTQFTDATAGGTAPYTWAWEFGDGQTSTAQNPSHVYAEAGSYIAKLTVTDTDGHVASVRAMVNVTNPMTVAMTAEPVLGSEPLLVNFTASAANGTAPYTYTWDFGDNTSGTGPVVSHTFDSDGVIEVKVHVVDALGHDTSNRIVVDILQLLAVDPDRIPEKGTVPFPVTFYSNANGGERPYKYLWDFADGSTSTEENPVHNFLIPGYYNVRLTIIDGLGRQATNVVAVDAGRAPTIVSTTVFLNYMTIYGIPFTIFGQ
ncbi:MAG: PKD domain-containing protein [Phycisphaerae bacterium]|jgi:PKD repeat protein